MIPLPNKKYNIIYADPPWKFSSAKYQDGNRGFGNRVENFYQTMDSKQICSLPVKDISEENSILFMWVTDSHLLEGLDVIKSWGFRYATIGFTWVKKYKTGSYCYNFGSYTLKSTEICLIGLKGKLKNIKNKNNVKGLVFAERTKHSKKPDCIRDKILELCGDKPRIELFARQKTEGWDCWGNEV
jgi:N6-adenosine-specific RNA methylase IME4